MKHRETVPLLWQIGVCFFLLSLTDGLFWPDLSIRPKPAVDHAVVPDDPPVNEPESESEQEKKDFQSRDVIPGFPLSNPAPDRKAANPSRPDSVANPAWGSQAASPARGSITRGSQSVNPGRGSHASNPSRGSQAASPSRGNQALNPSRGSQASNPSRSSQASNPSRGSQAGSPARGSKTANAAVRQSPSQYSAYQPPSHVAKSQPSHASSSRQHLSGRQPPNPASADHASLRQPSSKASPRQAQRPASSHRQPTQHASDRQAQYAAFDREAKQHASGRQVQYPTSDRQPTQHSSGRQAQYPTSDRQPTQHASDRQTQHAAFDREATQHATGRQAQYPTSDRQPTQHTSDIPAHIRQPTNANDFTNQQHPNPSLHHPSTYPTSDYYHGHENSPWDYSYVHDYYHYDKCLCNCHNYQEPEEPEGQYCEWKLAFKAVAGSGREVYWDWFTSGDINGDLEEAQDIMSTLTYRDGDILDKWNLLFIRRVKLEVFRSGVAEAWFYFDATASSLESWMEQRRMLYSTYPTIKSGDLSFCSIDGDGSAGRRFFISRSDGACADVCAYVMVMDTNSPECSYESDEPTPAFFYSQDMSCCAYWDEDTYTGLGDRLAISVKVCDLDL